MGVMDWLRRKLIRQDAADVLKKADEVNERLHSEMCKLEATLDGENDWFRNLEKRDDRR